MAIFLTGSTGYIGAHVAVNLLTEHGASLNLLVRARDAREAEERLWRGLQLHLEFPGFYEYLQTRIRIFRGDLTTERFGLSTDDYDRLVHTTDSIIHCAASLNRKSEKSCLNVNLRGTLEVLKLGMQVDHYHGLRRFSHVSTVAVAGKRQDEVVTEGPSIVLGDSRRAETTQFDMVRAFVFLAGLPVLPLRSKDRVDIVNADFVADAIATLHVKEKTQFDTYHLSSGRAAQSFRQLTESLAAAQDKRGPIFLPFLQTPFTSSVNAFSNRKSSIGRGAALMKVFMPYLTFNTVFDNTRVITELGCKPVPFSQYSYPLLKFSRETNFTYPYREWPAKVGGSAA